MYSLYKTAILIIMCLWISFFSSNVSVYWQGIFRLTMAVLLLSLFFTEYRVYRALFNKYAIPFLIFIICVSFGLHGDADINIAYQHFFDFIAVIPLFFFLGAILIEKSKVKQIAFCFTVMAAIVVVYGLFEFLTSFNPIYESSLATSFCYQAFKGVRMMSFHIHPAPLATYLLAALPLSIYAFINSRRALLRIMTVVCIVMITAGIILTFSRGGLLGLAIEVGIFFWLLCKKNKHQLAISSAAAVIVFAVFLSTFINDRNRSGFTRYYNAAALGDEYIYARKALRALSVGRVIMDHPFIGLGFGQYRFLFDKYLPELSRECNYLSRVPDCMYLTFLAETGLIGFCAFVVFIFFLIRATLKYIGETEKHRIWQGMLLAGFSGMLCTFLTYDGLYWLTPSCLFWFYAGMFFASNGIIYSNEI